MSRPIKETPILYGKAARKFEEEMQRVENMTREERMANRKKVEEGNFSNDEIMERDHFEITNSWEGHKSGDEAKRLDAEYYQNNKK